MSHHVLWLRWGDWGEQHACHLLRQYLIFLLYARNSFCFCICVSVLWHKCLNNKQYFVSSSDVMFCCANGRFVFFHVLLKSTFTFVFFHFKISSLVSWIERFIRVYVMCIIIFKSLIIIPVMWELLMHKVAKRHLNSH